MPEFVPTPEQEEILVHNPDRHARVLAGPGTGKSATLVLLVDKLLSGRPTPRIRLLTFTRAATSELARKVSEHPAAVAERPSTIHSFAMSVLLRNPGAGDFPKPLRIADDWERKNILWPTFARRAGVQVGKLDRLEREMAANWESLRPDTDPKVKAEDRARFLGVWNEHREIFGYTLLSELPYALLGALRDHPDLEGVDYDLIVVDEYQDLNACDLMVLRMMGDRGCSIIAAGDDDQSIYSFRKAAPEGIRRFPEDYPESDDYPLSFTQRFGNKIIEWASYVIEGDPDRPRTRPRLRSVRDSPGGEVALLLFRGEVSEAKGICDIIQKLVEEEGVLPSEILVLLRADYQGRFSNPIKKNLTSRRIPFSDAGVVDRILAGPANRQMLEVFRLLVHRVDSIAWASLLLLTPRIGNTFTNYIYDRARRSRARFGQMLLDSYASDFPNGPTTSSRKARELIMRVLAWLDEHPLPEEIPEEGWGNWIIETAGDDIVPAPSDELRTLLLDLDGIFESDQGLGRYLGQIGPLGKDLALAESSGVRIMTMAGAKGLTVRATIVAALEEGIIPRPDCDLGEERRLLYVAMTRAREFLYCIWAGRRRGPTARAGRPRVGEMRRYSSFLQGGPVESQDGSDYIRLRWG